MNEDTQKRIGTILDETARRDAIHVAVAPVVAGEDLEAGDHCLVRDGRAYPTMSVNPGAAGVADPFLRGSKANIQEGQRFYLFLYPNTVTGMRHVWTAPGFDTTRREGT